MNYNKLIFVGYNSNLELNDESLMGAGEDSVDGPEGSVKMMSHLQRESGGNLKSLFSSHNQSYVRNK